MVEISELARTAVATAAAAAITTAAASTAAAFTTTEAAWTAAASTASAASWTRLGLAHGQRTAAVVLAVESLDGSLGRSFVSHRNKAESA